MRLACLTVTTLAILLAACHSNPDTVGPTNNDMFTGTWTGAIDGIAPVTAVASQLGTVVTGSATLTYGSTTYSGSFTGTSTPPNLVLNVALGDTTGTYTATYITADSVAGTFAATVSTSPGDTVKGQLSLVKQGT